MRRISEADDVCVTVYAYCHFGPKQWRVFRSLAFYKHICSARLELRRLKLPIAQRFNAGQKNPVTSKSRMGRKNFNRASIRQNRNRAFVKFSQIPREKFDDDDARLDFECTPWLHQ